MALAVPSSQEAQEGLREDRGMLPPRELLCSANVWSQTGQDWRARGALCQPSPVPPTLALCPSTPEAKALIKIILIPLSTLLGLKNCCAPRAASPRMRICSVQ